MDSSREIIDLTLSSDTPEASPILEDGEINVIETSSDGRSLDKKRKRPKRRRKNALGELRPCKINGTDEEEPKKSGSPLSIVNDGSTQERGGSALNDLFFVDTQPSQLPPIDASPINTPLSPNQKGSSSSLLLPAHVSVFGAEPVEILPQSDEEDGDYIEYLDSDRQQRDMVRYFDTQAKNEKKPPVKIMCKNCGEEGHRAAACSVIICLTCGVRDEHSTRSCPISKTCFQCGMKGHISATCPNRNSRRTGYLGSGRECGRCGSDIHNTNECTTIWRLYDYMTTEARDEVLKTRQSKRHNELGQGGEGYVAVDEWCYNCGGCGHWGDDCQDMRHANDRSNEPSAFSVHNLLSGPFSDEIGGLFSNIRQQIKPREPDFSADWGRKVPDFVGKQARRKKAEKLDKARQRVEEEEDADDWFGKRTAPNTSRSKGLQIKGQAQKMQFGRIQEPQPSTGYDRRPNPKPSLLSRVSDQGVAHFAPPNPRNETQLDYSKRREWESDRDRHGNNATHKSRDLRDDRERTKGTTTYGNDWRRHDYRKDRPRYRGGYS